MLTDVRRLILIAAIALLAAGCGDDPTGGERPVSAIATTPHVADLTRNVGGGRVDVRVLVPAGADPHGYEPRPSDARAIAGADLIVRSGGEVDEWLDDLLASAGGETVELTLIDKVRVVDGDPHWWKDPRNAVRAVAAIGDVLSRADPAGREQYERNAARYSRRLRELDRSIAACLARVPAERRKLVTPHDSYGYFATRYGIEVVGALIPSRSTQAQPSAKDTVELAERIEREGALAIFPETASSSRLERAVAREAGVRLGTRLLGDSLGPAGSAGETYIGAMAADAAAMAEGFSGGRVRCRPDTRRAASRRGR